MSSLYLATNTSSGKAYVGVSKDPRARWAQHRAAARQGIKTYFINALRKYGPNAFTFEVIQTFDTPAEAYLAEAYWIDRLREFGIPLYNEIGGGTGAYAQSLDTRRRISESLKGRQFSPEHRANISKARKGQKQTPAQKAANVWQRKGRIPWNKGKKIGPNPKVSQALKSYFAARREW